jgi:arsenate reductase (thioredoxin)
MEKQKKTRVMFVCIGNACRSPMAEAIARKEAGDILEISSAGLLPMGYLPEMTVQTLMRNGYSTLGLTSKPISREELRNTDLVLNMSGDSRAKALAHARQVEHWLVPDPYGEDEVTYQTILEDIQRRVRELSARLRKASAGQKS